MPRSSARRRLEPLRPLPPARVPARRPRPRVGRGPRLDGARRLFVAQGLQRRRLGERLRRRRGSRPGRRTGTARGADPGVRGGRILDAAGRRARGQRGEPGAARTRRLPADRGPAAPGPGRDRALARRRRPRTPEHDRRGLTASTRPRLTPPGGGPRRRSSPRGRAPRASGAPRRALRMPAASAASTLTSSSPVAAADARRAVVLTASPRAVKSSTAPAGPVGPT